MDDVGQMMILSAVLLLIGFIALSGMVARVSQLASQTTIENEQTILREVGPLADSMNNVICRLKASGVNTFTNITSFTSGNPVVTGTVAGFKPTHVGMLVSGNGIPPGTRVESFTDTTHVTLTAPPTSNGVNALLRFTPCLAPGTASTFNRTATTSPTMVASLTGALQQIQSLQAGRGLLMDWEISCATASTSSGQAVAHLFNGAVWVEVRSTVRFAVADCLAQGDGCDAGILACG